MKIMPDASRKVQCQFCGRVQDFDASYRHCLNCGNSLDDSDIAILKNPRIGRGMQGTALLGMIVSTGVFFFYSKYIGYHGFAIFLLIYIWGYYRSYLQKRESNQTHELNNGKLS
jgi:hypothetical protein